MKKVRMKTNPYASIAYTAWKKACEQLNTLTEVGNTFKFRMNELRRKELAKDKYKTEFTWIVNTTYGELLGFEAKTFNDCKYILRDAKFMRFLLTDACCELKESYRLSIARWS